jgi:hypothetical protein
MAEAILSARVGSALPPPRILVTTPVPGEAEEGRVSPKTQQPQEIAQSWAEAQRRLWEILEAQSAAMFALVDGLATAPNVPPQVRTQLKQVQELTRSWTETQRQLWEAMFAAVRQFTPDTAEYPKSVVPPIELLQQFSRPVLEAQAAWLRQWSGLLGGAHAGQPH